MFFWGGKCSYDLGGSTLPETNSSPQKLDELEDFLLSFWDSAYFQVLLLLVSGSVLEKTLSFVLPNVTVSGDLFANLLHLQKHRRGRGLLALARSQQWWNRGQCSVHVLLAYFYHLLPTFIN